MLILAFIVVAVVSAAIGFFAAALCAMGGLITRDEEIAHLRRRT